MPQTPESFPVFEVCWRLLLGRTGPDELPAFRPVGLLQWRLSPFPDYWQCPEADEVRQFGPNVDDRPKRLAERPFARRHTKETLGQGFQCF